MTDPSTPATSPDSAPPATVEAGTPAGDAAVVRAPGLATFAIEGRKAPGLFFVGWLLVLAAVGLAVFALAGAGAGPGGLVVWVAVFLAAGAGLVLLGGSETLERRAVGAWYAGPSPLVVVLAAAAIVQVAGVAVGLPLSLVGGSIPRPVGDLIAASVQGLVFLAVVRFMVVSPGALSWHDMGLFAGRASAVRGLLVGAAYLGPVLFAVLPLSLLLLQVFPVRPDSPLPATGSTAGLLVNLVTGMVIAPAAEELLFRGFALTAWQRLAGTRAAIVRSSLVFIVAHLAGVGADSFGEGLQLAFVVAVVRLPIALALGWLYARTRTLWVPIGLHAAYNAFLLIVAELALQTG